MTEQLAPDIIELIQSNKLIFNSTAGYPYIDFIYRGIRVTQTPLIPLYKEYDKGTRIDSDDITRRIIIHINISDFDNMCCTCPNPETCNCDCCKQRRESIDNPDFNCKNGADDSFSVAFGDGLNEKANEALEKIAEGYDLASQRSDFLTYLMNKDYRSLYVFSSTAAIVISDTISFNAPENTYTPSDVYRISMRIIDLAFKYKALSDDDDDDDTYASIDDLPYEKGE